MAIPNWLNNKTPQDKGRNFEKDLAKKLGVKPQPASGALPHYKEDIETNEFLIQVKTTEKKQYTIKASDLKDLVRHAVKIGKEPMMIIKLDGKTWSLMLCDE